MKTTYDILRESLDMAPDGSPVQIGPYACVRLLPPGLAYVELADGKNVHHSEVCAHISIFDAPPEGKKKQGGSAKSDGAGPVGAGLTDEPPVMRWAEDPDNPSPHDFKPGVVDPPNED